MTYGGPSPSTPYTATLLFSSRQGLGDSGILARFHGRNGELDSGARYGTLIVLPASCTRGAAPTLAMRRSHSYRSFVLSTTNHIENMLLSPVFAAMYARVSVLQAKYEEYLNLSGSFLATSIQQGSSDILPSVSSTSLPVVQHG